VLCKSMMIDGPIKVEGLEEEDKQLRLLHIDCRVYVEPRTRLA